MGKPKLTDEQAQRRIEMGRRIRFKRKSLHMTQEQLGALVGVGFQSVSGWENGRESPQGQRLPQVAQALKATVAYLTGEIGAPEDSLETMSLRLSERLGVKLVEALLEIPQRILRARISVLISDYTEEIETLHRGDGDSARS